MYKENLKNNINDLYKMAKKMNSNAIDDIYELFQDEDELMNHLIESINKPCKLTFERVNKEGVTHFSGDNLNGFNLIAISKQLEEIAKEKFGITDVEIDIIKYKVKSKRTEL